MTLLHGLLTVQEVARQFESISLQRPVIDVRYSRAKYAKQARLAGNIPIEVYRRDAPQRPKPYFRGFLSDPTFGGGLSL